MYIIIVEEECPVKVQYKSWINIVPIDDGSDILNFFSLSLPPVFFALFPKNLNPVLM